ncbi:MAG: Pyrrolo-quinoline quinone [Phycisphaerales bacterium]|nr:Pyrrolo-quinoline quinone [Phycisphaerales bacterium]
MKLTALLFTVEVSPMTRILTALLAIFVSLPALAEDWPQWRGPERTGHVAAGARVPDALPADPKILWHIPQANGVASPVVSGGRVFTLDAQDNKETVHAYDAATGKSLWALPLDELHKDSQSPAGPRCTPLVDGDRLYAQSCRGTLKCFSVADGKTIWESNYVKDFGAVFIGEKGKAEGATRHGYDGSPIIDGDHLITEAGGKPDAAFVCFDKLTGKVIWKAQSDTPAYAAPMIASIAGQRQLVTFIVEGVEAIDPATGKLLWRVPVKTALGRHVTTPVVVNDTVIVASHQAGLVGVKVSREGAGFKATQAWSAKESAINFSSPVIVGSHLYGLGPAKNLICVDTATGKQTWSQEGLFTNDAGHSHAGLIVMAENLLTLTDSGQLLLIAADPQKYRELGRAQVAAANWCNPAYADGKLFLRDNKELRCVVLVP